MDNFLDDVLDKFDPSIAVDEGVTTQVDNTPEPDDVDEAPQQQQQKTQQPDDDADVDPLTKQPLTDKKTDPKAQKDAKGKKDDKQQQQQQLRHGDLRDPRTGEVIRAGAERRHYEARVRAETQLRDTTTKLQQLQTQLQGYERAFQVPAQMGLNPQEAAYGASLAANLKRNPLGTIKELLTAAQAAGHNVAEFLGQAAGGINTEAVTRQVAQLTHPLMQEMQNRQRMQQAQHEADVELHTFMTDNPLAEVHHEVIADIMDARNCGLMEAWNFIQGYVLENGLDIRRSLKEQRIGGQQQQQPSGRAQRPVVQGNGAGTPGQQRQVQRVNGPAINHSTRNADIVRASMAEAGFDVDRI